jgi:mannose-6-phosphate isomerase-like protein (cupin superfamily)
VVDGQVEVWLDDQTYALTSGQSIVVPAGHPHGFRNTGTTPVHTLATLAASIFEAAYEDAREVPRRWLPTT